MSLDDKEQVYDIARIHDEHIVKESTTDTIGWTKATIDHFEVDDDTLRCHVDLPWGETHRYAWNIETLAGGRFETVCDAYGYSLSEFERLEGREIWLRVKRVKLVDGEIETKTNMVHRKVESGPSDYQDLIEGIVLIAIVVATIIALMIIL